MTAPYSTAIVEHFRRPRNYGALPNATSDAEGVNPLCGDRVRVAVLMDAEGAIAVARFTANACAICVASASLLTEHVRGMPRTDAAPLPGASRSAFAPVARRRRASSTRLRQ